MLEDYSYEIDDFKEYLDMYKTGTTLGFSEEELQYVHSESNRTLCVFNFEEIEQLLKILVNSKVWVSITIPIPDPNVAFGNESIWGEDGLVNPVEYPSIALAIVTSALVNLIKFGELPEPEYINVFTRVLVQNLLNPLENLQINNNFSGRLLEFERNS